AGGEDGTQPGEAVAVYRSQAGLLQCGEVTGAGAEDSNAFGIDQVQQSGIVRVQRGPVVQHQGSADGEPGGQPVPHHPATGGVVEQAVVRLQVRMQAQFLQV